MMPACIDLRNFRGLLVLRFGGRRGGGLEIQMVSITWLGNPNKVITFLLIFGACMNILFIVKVKLFRLIIWSYTGSPPPQHTHSYLLLLDVKPRIIIIF